MSDDELNVLQIKSIGGGGAVVEVAHTEIDKRGVVKQFFAIYFISVCRFRLFGTDGAMRIQINLCTSPRFRILAISTENISFGGAWFGK